MYNRKLLILWGKNNPSKQMHKKLYNSIQTDRQTNKHTNKTTREKLREDDYLSSSLTFLKTSTAAYNLKSKAVK